jgi:hypothetical protein
MSMIGKEFCCQGCKASSKEFRLYYNLPCVFANNLDILCSECLIKCADKIIRGGYARRVEFLEVFEPFIQEYDGTHYDSRDWLSSDLITIYSDTFRIWSRKPDKGGDVIKHLRYGKYVLDASAEFERVKNFPGNDPVFKKINEKANQLLKRKAA